MPKLSQFEKDLLENAAERLHTWATDTIMRCQVVDVSVGSQASIIASCLLHELTMLLESVNVPKEETLKLLAEYMRRQGATK